MNRTRNKPSNDLPYVPFSRLGVCGALLLGSLLLGAGCQTAKVTEERQTGAGPTTKPSIIYVQDFLLDPAVIQAHKGVLADLPGPGKVVDTALYGQKPPSERTKELVELMSNSLVKDIQKAGYQARRLRVGAPVPGQGWLVRGIYRQVEEGNRLRRSMIGFGVGKTDLIVSTYFDDLTQGTPKPFTELETDAHTRPLPGSAPALALSPYPAAARFVLSGKNLERNVTQTATRITEELVEQLDAVP